MKDKFKEYLSEIEKAKDNAIKNITESSLSRAEQLRFLTDHNLFT